MHSSETLSIEEADRFLRWREASVVAIIGERNGGKTTLIAELYNRFLHGAFADALFCHSLSLRGFEKKCFQSRAESGALYPDTPRTSAQDGLSFFHLAISNVSDLKRQDLLISERAGEVYREIRDKPHSAAGMIEIRKASSIVLIIDGERVAAPRKRHEVFASVRNIIRALIDTGNISGQTQIQLVTTKCDLLESDSMVEACEALSRFEQSIVTLIAGQFEVIAFRTSARDPRPGTEPARGLASLLKSWLKTIPLKTNQQQKMPELLSEFDRLALRRNIHEH
nr:hypothetical protein [Dickeya dadantii]